MNQLYRIFVIVWVALITAACNRDPQNELTSERRATVTIDCAGGIGVDVRTFVEGQLSNGDLEIGWEDADRFRLWSCKSSDETPVTTGVDFALYHHDMTFPIARFKGEIDVAAYNAGETYNYYAVSPLPASAADVNGTRVSYNIPAVQTGEFDGKTDIMTAQLVDAPALAEGHNPDIYLRFQHHVHVLRITIPENQMGEAVRSMELSFPTPVAGRLTVDAAGKSEPELTDGSEMIRLNFAQPKQVGDVVYVTIAPTTIPAEGVISMRIIGRTGETSTHCLGGVERVMAAGHFSPVELHVPQMKVRYTLLTFRLPTDRGVNTLGEAVNKVKITPSSGSLAGATLPDDSVLEGSELVYDVLPGDGRDYSVILMPEVVNGIVAGLNGKALTATFESESAQNIISTTASKTISLNVENIYDLSVPYLYVEDFSRIGGFTHEATTGANSVDGMEGWSISRANGTRGSHVHLRPFYAVISRHQGRLDSCPIGAFEQKPGSGAVLKNSVTAISLHITFTAGAEKVKTPLQLGWTTVAGNINASEGISNTVATVTLPKSSNLSPSQYAFDVKNVGLNARLSWRTNITGGSWGTYSDTPIDNIVVKIVK